MKEDAMIYNDKRVHDSERNGKAGCGVERISAFDECSDSRSGFKENGETDFEIRDDKMSSDFRRRPGDAGTVVQNNINSFARTPDEINDTIEETGNSIYRDKVIKAFLHYTRFTGFLLSRVINELCGVSLEEFRDKTGGSDFLDLRNPDYGTDQTKAVHLDVIFDYGFIDSLRMRINVEPQSSQESHSEVNEKSYSLVARAVYYASAAMATELQTSEEYHKMRKVYSVWICYDRPIPDMREPVIRYNMRPEKNYIYCKKDEYGRDSIFSNRHKFDDGDLLSVILISVKDIDDAVKSGKTDFVDDYDLNTLKEIRSLVSDTVTAAERREFFMKTNIDDGKGENSMTVFERMIYETEEEKKEAIREAEERRKQEEERRKQEEERRKQEEEKNRQLTNELEKYRKMFGTI